MLVDRVEYADKYFRVLPHLADALAFIKANPVPGEGKHLFQGGYLMYQSGMTKPGEEGAYEAHRKYIDVQILKDGHEIILWNRLENMQEAASYDAEKDKQAIKGIGSMLELLPGMFVVLWPEDAHKACRHADDAKPNTFAKYVVKLEL